MLINLLKSASRHGEKKAKVIWNPYPGPDHHQKVITSRGSPLAHAYHVWSTSVTVIVSYPARRTTDRMTERPITALAEYCDRYTCPTERGTVHRLHCAIVHWYSGFLGVTFESRNLKSILNLDY